ncbi:unnamed protein product [Didymodactylos carnosus]|uniref:NAD(P)(+)--arginine ADP-ribosyltransferase n=1 Tax=Didymodactylos carnosus TaxID=1234261 RepID=A0A8S2EQL1_9BILA|nr:unnamed protein product [Didymodactylos carnosus]CAF4035609.1 unnamed protein product [Didymodactylos carnosus]
MLLVHIFPQGSDDSDGDNDDKSNQDDNEIKYQWFWKSNKDPWLNDEEKQFTPYESNFNQIIEKAYLNGENEVVINKTYKIDFIHEIQINLNDAFKERPVLRQSLTTTHLPSATSAAATATSITTKFDTATSDCEQRIQFPTGLSRSGSFSKDTDFRGCSFIVDWYKWITNGKLKIKNCIIVDLAIKGILAESELYLDDKKKAVEDANHFISELRRVQHAEKLFIIQEVCIQLYTKESFLFRIINETLRDNNRDKFETLGPFCFLLYTYTHSPKNKQGKLPKQTTLYRGEPLTPDVIELYKLSIGSDTIWKWSQFVSTSKKREAAELFGNGNSLYVIEMKKRSASDQGVYIAKLSQFTMEEEVLLRPGIRFKIIKVEEEIETKMQIFYIDIIPSFMSGLN